MRGAPGQCGSSLLAPWLLVGLAFPLLSPDSSRAGLEAQEQAPGAADSKNQPRRVIFRLIRKTDGRPIPGALIVVLSYDFDLPDGGSMAVSRRDEPERLTDPEGRCLIELP